MAPNPILDLYNRRGRSRALAIQLLHVSGAAPVVPAVIFLETAAAVSNASDIALTFDPVIPDIVMAA